MMARTSLPDSIYEKRVGNIRERLDETNNDVLCLFSASNIKWLVGFHYLPNERPICLAVTDTDIHITVPKLEEERAKSNKFPLLTNIHQYFDYPGNSSGEYYNTCGYSPKKVIEKMFSNLNVNKCVSDSSGPPNSYGYNGPKLSKITGLDVTVVDWLQELRKVKNSAEIELLRESAKWGNLSHHQLRNYCEVGKQELWVEKKASLKASMSMLGALGDQYMPNLRVDFPAASIMISGSNTAKPHGMTQNRRLQQGDVIITGATADIDGYTSELERTMFMGEPSDEYRDYYNIMLEAQTIGIRESGAEVPCSRVDQAVMNYFKEQGVLKYTKHHTGHGLGLDFHEPGFIDRGNDEVMKPGHVYSIEPGIYLDGEAGFRHSDTILITEDGSERITYYPRKIEENVIPVN
jgi:Xaa-Pro aminopeptidase